MGTPFKMKGMSFGNSPMKQNKFNRPPEGFDWKASKKRAKETFQKFGAKKGHGTIEDLKARDNFNKRQVSKQKAKDFVKNLKIKSTEVVKKSTKEILKKGVSKAILPVAIATELVSMYKSGQKHSGGKIDPKQKSIMAEGRKKTGSIMTEGKKKTQSIFNKKK